VNFSRKRRALLRCASDDLLQLFCEDVSIRHDSLTPWIDGLQVVAWQHDEHAHGNAAGQLLEADTTGRRSDGKSEPRPTACIRGGEGGSRPAPSRPVFQQVAAARAFPSAGDSCAYTVAVSFLTAVWPRPASVVHASARWPWASWRPAFCAPV